MKKNYLFPQYSRSIVADSREQAEKILDDQLRAEWVRTDENTQEEETETAPAKKQVKKADNKGIPGGVSNK